MLVAAAVLTLFIGLAHSWLGEKKIVQPLLARDDMHSVLGSPNMTRAIIRGAWHVTTVAWWGMAAMLIWMALDADAGRDAYLWVFTATFGFCGVASLIMGRGKHFSWAVFLAAAACTGWAVIAG